MDTLKTYREFEELFIDLNNLPLPLPKEEIYELFYEMQNGDEQAREQIIYHNIRLVLSEVVHQFHTADYDKKELVSIGLIGLISAVDSFDTSLGNEFCSYARTCIDNCIRTSLRKPKTKLIFESLDEPIDNSQDSSDLKVQDRLSDDIDIEEDYIEEETRQFLREKIEELSDRDRKIVFYYFGFCDDVMLTQQQIADRLGISVQRVSKRLEKIKEKLGTQLEEAGIMEKRKPRVKRRTVVKTGMDETLHPPLNLILLDLILLHKDEPLQFVDGIHSQDDIKKDSSAVGLVKKYSASRINKVGNH